MPQLSFSHSAGISYSLRSFLIIASSVILLDQGLVAQAQITPNGAGTVVNSQGNQINITGGTQTGANLFHSFRDFNVTPAQIANFLSNPQTQNILARVNGGNPSLINGLLQVTGGNSHLFLMNPAGIVFGRGASLNIPASFTVTTANQIGLGNNFFNAVGDNNFSALTGNPDSFIFNTTQAGSIINAGNLAVGNGQNISLIAGNTVNTGRLTAPGGEIQVLAVPGTNRVRLSQPGQVLSLEIVPPADGVLKAVDLPVLLTGRDLPGIQVDPTGQVQVAGTSLPNQQGMAVASGAIDVSSNTGNGGTIQVLGNRVAVLSSRINANGATGGGMVRLGGEYLGGRDTGIAPEFRFNSQRTLVDRNSVIRVNATVTGAGGRVIVWADQNTGYFGRITGRGATDRGGFVEVSGRENLAFDGRVELPGFNDLGGSLLLDPANITIVPGTNGSQVDDTQITADATILSGDTPVNMTISAGALGAIAGTTPINIIASGNIDFASNVTLTSGPGPSGQGGAPVSFTAGSITSAGTFNLTARGHSLTMTADIINAPNLTIDTSPAGNISLTANMGNLAIGTLLATSGLGGVGGNIILNSPQGNIVTRDATTNGFNNNSGNVNFTAQGSIVTGNIATNSFNSNGGSVNLTTTQGNITATSIITSGTGTARNSGDIYIDSGNRIQVTGNIPSCGGSVCSNGLTGALSGRITFRQPYVGSFEGGSSSTNGTAGSIIDGTLNYIAPYNLGVFPPLPGIPFNVFSIGGGLTEIIILSPPVVNPVAPPPASPINPELLLLLQNPAVPPTPAPVVAGTLPEAPSTVESPSPLTVPVVIPIVIPTPQPIPQDGSTSIPTPLPSPLVISTPISTPIPLLPSPTLNSPLLTVLANISPQSSPPESPQDSLSIFNSSPRNFSLITNPSDEEVSSILSIVLPFSSLPENRNNLNQANQSTGIKPALIYVFFAPHSSGIRDEDILEVIMITEQGKPIRVQLVDTNRRQVLSVARSLGDGSVNLASQNGETTDNMPTVVSDRNAARQMYQWLLAPLEQELQQRGINNLTFILYPELSGLPLQFLYDGQGLVGERYTISRP